MGAQAAFESAALFRLLLSLLFLSVGSGAQEGEKALQIFERLSFTPHLLFFDNRGPRPDDLLVIEVAREGAWNSWIQPCRPRISSTVGVACCAQELAHLSIYSFVERVSQSGRCMVLLGKLTLHMTIQAIHQEFSQVHVESGNIWCEEGGIFLRICRIICRR